MERKWFCELCKICVPYTKLAINDHIRTQKHQKNKTKDLDYKHTQAKLKNLSKEEKFQYQAKKQQEIGNVVEMESMVDHFKNIQKLVGGNDFESQHKQFLLKKQQKWMKDNGYQQGLIYQRKDDQEIEEIVQQKQNQKIIHPIEAVSNSQLINNTLNNVWVLMKDIETGKMCFYNKISKVKKFEKPFGLKISNEDQRIWEESQENQGIFPEFEQKQPDQEGIIGQWKECKEDFYEKYKAQESLESDNDEDENIKQAQFIIFGDNEQTQMNLVDQIVVYQQQVQQNQQEDQQTLKNDILKKMIEQDFDLQNNIKTIYQKNISKKDEHPIFKKRLIQKKQNVFDD